MSKKLSKNQDIVTNPHYYFFREAMFNLELLPEEDQLNFQPQTEEVI